MSLRLGIAMRFSGEAEEWARDRRSRGFSCATWPFDTPVSADLERAFVRAAAACDLAIADVRCFADRGNWTGGMLSPDDIERRRAVEHVQERLDLAERIGAGVCVAYAGGRTTVAFGHPHPENVSRASHEILVDEVRTVIDAVKPKRACVVFDGVAKTLPDSPESYLDLIRDVDRAAFAVNLDVTNWIGSVRHYYDTSSFIRHCFRKLSPYVRTIHVKDIVMEAPAYTPVLIREVPLGEGGFDLRTLVREAGRMTPNAMMVLEHLTDDESYDRAAAVLRAIAHEEGVLLP